MGAHAFMTGEKGSEGSDMLGETGEKELTGAHQKINRSSLKQTAIDSATSETTSEFARVPQATFNHICLRDARELASCFNSSPEDLISHRKKANFLGKRATSLRKDTHPTPVRAIQHQ